MYLYVAETVGTHDLNKGIVIKQEITQKELTQLNSAFRVCSIYNSITQIKNIVVENGENFKGYMSPQNLQRIHSEKLSPEKAIMYANKFVLNYASSVSTYIDMEIRLLEKHCKEQVETFRSLCNHFYDNTMEYRFWVLFRNFIVHCEFPYTVYQESIEDGCRIICLKEQLLKYKKWKHCQGNIEKMEVQVDLPGLVDNMSSIICALYIDFFRYFATDIIDGITTYGSFCRKYEVERPVILKMHEPKQLEGSRMQPLPVKELRAAFEVLKSNPRVEIDIKD